MTPLQARVLRRRYTRWFCGAVVLLAGSVALFNAVIDPLGVYPAPWAESLAPYKMHLIDRIPKAEIARTRPLDAVFIGDSRVLRGFDPQHPGFREFGETYNLGISAGSVYEATRMIDLCLTRHTPKLIVWNLAPELVNDPRRDWTFFDFEWSRLNPQLDSVMYHAHNLWGRDLCRASFDVLKQCSRKNSANIFQGFSPDWNREPDPYEVFCRWLPTSSAALVQPTSSTSESSDSRELLLQTMARVQSQDCRLIVVFPPVHAAYLEGLSQIGEWDNYEEGKRMVVALADECNNVSDERPPIRVWDFSSFHGLPAEPPPKPGSEQPMQWYLDPLHFRETLGNLVIDRILDRSVGHSDFGVILTSQNLESHLSALRFDRDMYRRNSEEVIRLVSEQSDALR